MKHFVTYLILFSLAIVTVPREWVHDCEHIVAHHDDSDNDSGTELSQDDCFACEYDMDYMEYLDISLPTFANKPFTALVLSKLEAPSFEKSGEKHRRGPPSIG